MDFWPRWLCRAGNPLQSGRLDSEIRTRPRIDRDIRRGECNGRGWLRIEGRKRRVRTGTKGREGLRFGGPLWCARETLEKLGFDPQVLGTQIGDLGRKGRCEMLEVERDRRRLGRSFGCGRAARIGCCHRLLRRYFGENVGVGAGTCSSALHLGHVTTAPALPGAAASNWLQR